MRKSTAILSAAVMALATAVSMSPAQAASYDVSASISTSSAQSGDGPYIKGSISPARSKAIKVQRYIGGNWQNIKSATTNGDGKYGTRLSPEYLDGALGSLKFRVVLDSPNTGKSGTVTKTIYGWRHLSDMTASSGDSFRFYDDGVHLTVDGHDADDGWISAIDGVAYTKWNLQEKCIKLTGFAGLDDYTSDTASLAKLYIGLDGTSHDYDRTFSQYETATLDKSLYKTHYLTFKAKRIEIDENAPLGVGYPRVLCSKDLTD
ncbi:hypothetical protein J2X11_000461 [Aeromicrobium panaciterrae]|uniref:Uncharacterized protein n=1 Tax=Aeromicrobium panaciterrae TaxID=363861 RepID=A0ABU1UKA1_9ACTN|nr:hypothetical protein [Aeromicrobium panaciterrae]MDR7085622.1 hypothetical protein [Aeromicrobium panaciterrae]